MNIGVLKFWSTGVLEFWVKMRKKIRLNPGFNLRLTFAAVFNIFSLFSQTVSGISRQLNRED
jgi:hypothetical protein